MKVGAPHISKFQRNFCHTFLSHEKLRCRSLLFMHEKKQLYKKVFFESDTFSLISDRVCSLGSCIAFLICFSLIFFCDINNVDRKDFYDCGYLFFEF